MGEYQLQAAIAAVHDRAAHADDTDWPQILALYGLLERMTGNPIVTLNRAVAAAMADGPAAGLAHPRRDRRAAGRALPPRRRPRAPARDGRRHGGRSGALSCRGRPHDEPAGAALPGGAGRAPQVPGVRRRGGDACHSPRPRRSHAGATAGLGSTRPSRASSRRIGDDRPEALHGAVDAERQLPEDLRDRREALQGAAAASATPNMTSVPETMMSGPPTRPSIAIFRGTRPELYIR